MIWTTNIGHIRRFWQSSLRLLLLCSQQERRKNALQYSFEWREPFQSKIQKCSRNLTHTNPHPRAHTQTHTHGIIHPHISDPCTRRKMLHLNCMSEYKVIWLFSLLQFAHKKTDIYTRISCACVPISHRGKKWLTVVMGKAEQWDCRALLNHVKHKVGHMCTITHNLHRVCRPIN